MPSIRNSALSRRRFLVSPGAAGLRAAALALVRCGSGDDDERARQLFAAREIAWRDGGDLIWGFQPLVLARDPALDDFGLTRDGAPLFHRARFAA